MDSSFCSVNVRNSTINSIISHYTKLYITLLYYFLIYILLMNMIQNNQGYRNSTDLGKQNQSLL